VSLPTYVKGTALGAAVDAYDAARVAFHRREYGSQGGGSMSDANKNSIAPMILEAIAAWERATLGETELRSGLFSPPQNGGE